MWAEAIGSIWIHVSALSRRIKALSSYVHHRSAT
jgi:hypothetical protein